MDPPAGVDHCALVGRGPHPCSARQVPLCRCVRIKDLIEFLVRTHVNARKNLIPLEVGKCGLFYKVPDHPDTLAHQFAVASILKVVHQDARRIAGVRRAQLNFTAAVRAHQTYMDLKGMLL